MFRMTGNPPFNQCHSLYNSAADCKLRVALSQSEFEVRLEQYEPTEYEDGVKLRGGTRRAESWMAPASSSTLPVVVFVGKLAIDMTK